MTSLEIDSQKEFRRRKEEVEVEMHMRIATSEIEQEVKEIAICDVQAENERRLFQKPFLRCAGIVMKCTAKAMAW